LDRGIEKWAMEIASPLCYEFVDKTRLYSIRGFEKFIHKQPCEPTSASGWAI
jgi:hypothetical protein